jgi:predicted permease
MSPDDARAESIRRFGNMAVVSAECRRYGSQRDRQMARTEYFAELRQDLAYALRQLKRAPAFSTIAIATLAIGVGASAAVFSAVYAVILNPLPFADAGRVVNIMPMRRGEADAAVSAGELASMRQVRNAFSSVAGIVSGGGMTLTGYDAPEIIEGARVTHDYFTTLGVAPMYGRDFVEDDDVPGAPNVVMISHAWWKSRFNEDRGLIGRSLRLHDEMYMVVGVMPPSFDETSSGEKLWTPLRITPEQFAGGDGRWLSLVARLAPGVTLSQASQAATLAHDEYVKRTTPESRAEPVVIKRSLDVLVGDLRTRLFVLLGAVGLVLLIACVNVANLLLARGTVRAREFAVRSALGAARSRIVRQLLAESFMLAVIGSIAGVLIAMLLVEGLVFFAPDGVPRIDQATINVQVLAFTLLLAIGSSVLIGLVPAIRSAGPEVQSSLKDGARGAGSGGTRDRLRATLVGAEVALALTLLSGAGLLIRTAWRLQHVDPGFDAAQVMTARLLLPGSQYTDASHIVRTFEEIRAGAARIPGVESASLTSVVPLSNSVMTTSVSPEGRTLSRDERVRIDIRYNAPGYFGTMRMKLVDGRDIDRTDEATTPPVAVISQSLADKLWPGERAVGKRIDAMSFEKGKPNYVSVIGVVNDVRDAALGKPVVPTMYFPMTQVHPTFWPVLGRSMVLVTRTTTNPESMIPELRRVVMSVDPLLPLADNRTMESYMASSTSRTRFNTMLLVTLSVIALLLAAVGVYGVVSYYVSQRTREIGVRIALGAAPSDIWQLVFRRGFTPIGWGVLAGVALSLATTRLLREQLYEVSPQDPVTLVAVAITLVAVAVLATTVPARRAMRVAPVTALASE